MRDTLAPLGYGDAKIQEVDEPELGETVYQIATPTLGNPEVIEVREAHEDRPGGGEEPLGAADELPPHALTCADGEPGADQPRAAHRAEIADVASTAVNSDMIVPTPRVNAKPLTLDVARVNRMNATPIVTTFASMIVRSALA